MMMIRFFHKPSTWEFNTKSECIVLRFNTKSDCVVLRDGEGNYTNPIRITKEHSAKRELREKMSDCAKLDGPRNCENFGGGFYCRF